MSLQTKVIGRTPTDHGPYNPNTSYGKKFCVTLFGCMWESLHDNNNTAPAVWDGGDTITPNLVDWKKVSGDYNAWLMNRDKPATSEQYPFNGMGRVTLQKNLVEVEEGGETVTKNLLTQAMFEDGDGNPLTNTVFEIPYDFELAEDITIPANCVLKFDGGSISGSYALTMNGCYIDGNANFGAGVTFSGTIKNGFFNVMWMNDSDFGDKVNRAATYFKDIYTPPLDITFATPINIGTRGTAGRNFVFDSRLTFNGTRVNNGAAITISEIKAVIKINSLVRDDFVTGNDWRANRTMNIIGVKFLNCYNCLIEINTVQGFNECIRLHSYGTSCVGNFVKVGSVYDYNYGIRLYQENGGWTHENTFIGNGEIRNHQVSNNNLGEKYAFYLAGPNADNVSYKDPDAIDTRDGVDCIIVENFCVENHIYPFYLRNANITIRKVREESCTGLFKAYGNVAVDYETKYSNIANSCNVDDTSTIRLLKNDMLASSVTVEIGYGKSQGGYPKPAGNIVLYNFNTNEVSFSDPIDEYHCAMGVVMSRNAFIQLSCQASSYLFAYLDSNYNNITDTVADAHPEQKNMINMSYYTKYFRGASGTIGVPSEVSYVFAGVPFTLIGGNKNLVPLTIRSSGGISLYGGEIVRTGYGASKRPAYLWPSIPFYDQSLEKNIYLVGGVWKDACGNNI